MINIKCYTAWLNAIKKSETPNISAININLLQGLKNYNEVTSLFKSGNKKYVKENYFNIDYHSR